VFHLAFAAQLPQKHLLPAFIFGPGKIPLMELYLRRTLVHFLFIQQKRLTYTEKKIRRKTVSVSTATLLNPVNLNNPINPSSDKLHRDMPYK